MVLDQVPQLGATLQVGGDHGCPGTEAVRATGSPQHTFWNGQLLEVLKCVAHTGGPPNSEQGLKGRKHEYCRKTKSLWFEFSLAVNWQNNCNGLLCLTQLKNSMY